MKIGDSTGSLQSLDAGAGRGKPADVKMETLSLISLDNLEVVLVGRWCVAHLVLLSEERGKDFQ